jgi:uridylate kinase
MCRDNDVRMVVFGLEEHGNVTRALKGERIGTLVTAG